MTNVKICDTTIFVWRSFDMQVVIDIEANGLTPTLIHCVVCRDLDTDKEYIFTHKELYETKEFYQFALGVTRWIGHNFIDYDRHWLNKLIFEPQGYFRIKVKNIDDTLVMSRLDYPMRPGGHSLENLATVIGSPPKIAHEDWTTFTPEMLERCRRDVEINRDVYKYLLKRLEGFSAHSIRLEHDTAYILSQMKRDGFKFNRALCEDILAKCTTEAEELLGRIRESFKPIERVVGTYKAVYKKRPIVDHTETRADGSVINRYKKGPDGKNLTEIILIAPERSKVVTEEFNPASAKQIIERMEGLWKPYIFTPTGQPQICEENLLTVTPEAPECVKDFVKYKTLESRKSMLTSYLECLDENDFMHGDVYHIGAKTHRMAHRNPNTGNIPHENRKQPELDCYGKEFRKLFIPRAPDRVMVGIDIASIQVRMLAHYIGNEEYIDIVSHGDPHRKTMEASEGMITLRDTAKTFIYAFFFGCGAAKAGSIIGGTEKDGKMLLDKFIKNIPGMAVFKHKTLPMIARRGWFYGLDGRKMYVDSERDILPAMLQGGEAIIMKEALRIAKKDLTNANLDSILVAVVHDEMQRDTLKEHAEQAGEICKQAIINAGVLLKCKCPLNADVKIGPTWNESH